MPPPPRFVPLVNLAKWDSGKSTENKPHINPTANPQQPNIKPTMSHFTTIQTQVRDLAALRSALGEIGLSLHTGITARGYAQQQLQAAYVIQLHGPYDIAINPAADGSYGLTTDWWNGHVEKEVGPQFGRLLQLYGIHKATIEARKRGHMVHRITQKDGSIKLTIGGV